MPLDAAVRTVTVVEVGPRDGLQNEGRSVPTAAKIAFVEALAAAGLPVVEATSFVSPAAVPQLADAEEVMRGIAKRPDVRYPVLVPNERGYERAVGVGAESFALFAAATEEFSQANVRGSIAETFARFSPIARRAFASGYWLRGYVSVAFACPYHGAVAPKAAIDVTRRLFDLGCQEVALADTIGRAVPADVTAVLELAAGSLPIERLALHLHDTAGRAIENVAVGLAHGVRTFDGAAGGLGGCPFAPGAPGNLATEVLVAYLEGEGYRTGVDVDAVKQAFGKVRETLDSALSEGP
jgi:isopropylmalate/homocitrate/citramalate synthase